MPYHRVAEAWYGRLASWLLVFDVLAPVRRLGIARRDDRVVIERGKRGLVVDIHTASAWMVGVTLGAKLGAIERLTLSGTLDPWSKPDAAFAKSIKKLRAAKTLVEIREGWQSFAPP